MIKDSGRKPGGLSVVVAAMVVRACSAMRPWLQGGVSDLKSK